MSSSLFEVFQWDAFAVFLRVFHMGLQDRWGVGPLSVNKAQENRKHKRVQVDMAWNHSTAAPSLFSLKLVPRKKRVHRK